MTEPSLSEVRFVEMLNRISAGWGDHLNQLEEEQSFVKPLTDKNGTGQEFVVEITTEPVFDEEDNQANYIRVFLEIRQRGEPEGLITRLDWPLSIDERLSPESDTALDLFFTELGSVGFPEHMLPSK